MQIVERENCSTFKRQSDLFMRLGNNTIECIDSFVFWTIVYISIILQYLSL